MAEVAEHIRSLGGLHDSVLLSLRWRSDEKCLEMAVDDIHSNFGGLDAYPGPTKARFVFGQSHLDLEVDLSTQGLMIYNWTLETGVGANFKSQISSSPRGRVVVEGGQIDLVRANELQKNSIPASALLE